VANLYVGLKNGNAIGISITAAVMSWAVYRTLALILPKYFSDITVRSKPFSFSTTLASTRCLQKFTFAVALNHKRSSPAPLTNLLPTAHRRFWRTTACRHSAVRAQPPSSCPRHQPTHWPTARCVTPVATRAVLLVVTKVRRCVQSMFYSARDRLASLVE
jgi:hypothetical protein